jgi:hypothetical protein
MNNLTLSKEQLLGVWKLKAFANIDKDGHAVFWDGQLKGHLIYTDEDIVSVSMNRFRETKSGEIEHKYSFYAGNYKILDAETIEHTIEEAPDPKRIGTNHQRKVKFKENNLELRGKGLTGEVSLLWERS